MDYWTTRTGPAVTLKISGELDAVTVDDLRGEFDQIVATSGERVVVDLSGLRLLDSMGVRALISIFRRLTAEGRRCEVVGVQGQPSSLFELLRLERLFRTEARSEVPKT
jgi:anti-anti-sigma factor